ncbi:MAG: IS1380 family transposase [FCB group bacterium]|nr:IS1380 family transposase [FCB group bacterium]
MRKDKKPSFKIKASNELLTDRGGLALFDEYVQSTGILDKVDQVFPWPGSNRGISASSYFRVLGLHMFDGGRYLEEIKDLKDDKAFRKVLNLDRFPGPDAVGDWLRRHGEQAMESDYFDQLMSKMLVKYLKATDLTDGYVLDMDASLIASDKGDGTMSYAGIKGYMPMFGFLSDGKHKPFNIYDKFRQGYASPQSDQLAGIKRSHELLNHYGQKLKAVRIDSAGYMSDIVNYCDEENIKYTIVADHNSAVMNRVASIPESCWQTFYDRKGIGWGWEIAETTYVMRGALNKSRLIVKRQALNQADLFGAYKYYIIISNIPKKEQTAQDVMHFHNGRGNAEKFIEDAKYGLNLKVVPTGQIHANALYYMIGMLVFNLVKLMQLTVLPDNWHNSMITSIRHKLFRTVARVVSSGRQLWLAITASVEKVMVFVETRGRIYALE